jgi:hypothetical protein
MQDNTKSTLTIFCRDAVNVRLEGDGPFLGCGELDCHTVHLSLTLQRPLLSPLLCLPLSLHLARHGSHVFGVRAELLGVHGFGVFQGRSEGRVGVAGLPVVSLGCEEVGVEGRRLGG